MKVINRSDEIVVYSLPELNIRRVFQPFEYKEITEEELEALIQSDGGDSIIKDYLLCEDREWVNRHFDAPIEYWWTQDKIKDCLLKDDLDLFSETLDYAPEGVVDLIKFYSWKIPITDLNKIKVIFDKTGFDVQGAIATMSTMPMQNHITSVAPQRKRREI